MPLSLVACSSGDNAADAPGPAETFAPKPVGEITVATVPAGTASNLTLIVVNNNRGEAHISVDLEGAPAIDHLFAGSNGDLHPRAHAFEFQRPARATRVEARAGKQVASAQADLSVKPQLWVVVQSYDSAELGIEITTYDERPLFG